MAGQNIQQNLSLYFVLFVVFSLVCWVAGSKSVQPPLVSIDNIVRHSTTCVTGSKLNQDTFVVFIPNSNFAQALGDIICANPVLKKQYGKVEIRWSVKEHELIQHVGKGIADMAMGKENVMRAFATSSAHGYQVIGSYQDYSAYLIALKEKPIATKQYLWGKRLGLLDYPSSRSGHIIPKSMLHNLGLNEENLHIVYASSHQELRQLLLAGKVDMIASYWQREDEQYFSSNYITQIQEQVSGSKWYLKMQTQNTDLLCEMQNSLRQLAESMDSAYYSSLYLPPVCSQPSKLVGIN